MFVIENIPNVNNLSVNFFVSEEKKIVICKLNEHRIDVVKDFIEKGIPYIKDMEVNDFYIGKAICMDEDTFDVEKGKRIAYNKAMVKLINAKIKAVRRVYKKITNECDNLEAKYTDLADYHNAKLKHIISDNNK